jgi:hypothetical protein
MEGKDSVSVMQGERESQMEREKEGGGKREGERDKE